MKGPKKDNSQGSELSLFRRKFPLPDFALLLKKPLLDVPLPDDFKVEAEVEHLKNLWESAYPLSNYQYEHLVHAGGSGMVFKVVDENSNAWAMKIVRKRLYELKDSSGEVATSLSPVSESELRALQKLSHPNVVRLKEAIENGRGVVALCTTYVERPLGLDRYLQSTLEKTPSKKGIHAFSPQRLDDACAFLGARFAEIASAVRHMHAQRIYHFDIKPANIMISEASHQAVLTDMGSCIHAESLTTAEQIRVHFTWTYAHPDLTTIISNPQSISGGGLKASAKVNVKDDLAKYDLFALGKTLQEALAIIEREFRARCHASFGFRFLHMVACLLLDGRNSPARNDAERRKAIVEKDGRRFADDIALDYPPELFEAHKITSTSELVERLVSLC